MRSSSPPTLSMTERLEGREQLKREGIIKKYETASEQTLAVVSRHLLSSHRLWLCRKEERYERGVVLKQEQQRELFEIFNLQERDRMELEVQPEQVLIWDEFQKMTGITQRKEMEQQAEGSDDELQREESREWEHIVDKSRYERRLIDEGNDRLLLQSGEEQERAVARGEEDAEWTLLWTAQLEGGAAAVDRTFTRLRTELDDESTRLLVSTWAEQEQQFLAVAADAWVELLQLAGDHELASSMQELSVGSQSSELAAAEAEEVGSRENLADQESADFAIAHSELATQLKDLKVRNASGVIQRRVRSQSARLELESSVQESIAAAQREYEARVEYALSLVAASLHVMSSVTTRQQRVSDMVQHAASVIVRHAVGYLTRTALRSQHASSIIVRHAAGCIARTALRRQRAGSVLVRHTAGYITRTSLRSQRACRVVVRHAAGCIARTTLRSQRASRVIVRHAAGCIARSALRSQHALRIHDAVVSLQRVGRGWMVREDIFEQWEDFREEALFQKQQFIDSLLTIQWAGRDFLAKKQAAVLAAERRVEEKKVNGAKIMQRILRIRLAEHDVAIARERETMRRIVKVQSLGRAAEVRRTLRHQRDVTISQGFMRAKLSHVLLFLHQRNVPARTIQRAARVMLANRKVSRAKELRRIHIDNRMRHNAVIRIQKMARDWSFRNAAMLQQLALRRARHKVLEDALEYRIDGLQKLFRGCMGRRAVAVLHRRKINRLSVIQSALRTTDSRNEKRRRRDALEANLKAQLADNLAIAIRCMVAETTTAALEGHDQAKADALEFHQHCSSYVVQRYARCCVAVRKVEALRTRLARDAVTLQSLWRGKKVRLDAERSRQEAEAARIAHSRLQAALGMQRWWRRVASRRYHSASVVQRAFLHVLTKLITRRRQARHLVRLHRLRLREVEQKWDGAALAIRQDEALEHSTMMKDAPQSADRRIRLLVLPTDLLEQQEALRRKVEMAAVMGYRNLLTLHRQQSREAWQLGERRLYDARKHSFVLDESIYRFRIMKSHITLLRGVRMWFAEEVQSFYHALRVAEVVTPETAARDLVVQQWCDANEELFSHSEQLTVLLDADEAGHHQQQQGGEVHPLPPAVRSEGEEEEEEEPLGDTLRVPSVRVVPRMVPAQVVQHVRAFADVPIRGKLDIDETELAGIVGFRVTLTEQLRQPVRKQISQPPPPAEGEGGESAAANDGAEGFAVASVSAKETRPVSTSIPSPSSDSVRLVASDTICVDRTDDGVLHVGSLRGEPSVDVTDTATVDLVRQAGKLCSVVTGLDCHGSALTTAGVVTLLLWAKTGSYPLTTFNLADCCNIDDLAALHLVRYLTSELPTLREVNVAGSLNISLRKRQLLRHAMIKKEEDRRRLLTRRQSSLRGRLEEVRKARTSILSTGGAGDASNRWSGKQDGGGGGAADAEVPHPSTSYRGRPLLYPRRQNKVV